jgi:hypothetical protein
LLLPEHPLGNWRVSILLKDGTAAANATKTAKYKAKVFIFLD